MRLARDFRAIVVLAAALLVSASPAGAQGARAAAPRPAIPRTADAKPNLSGVWQVRNSAAAVNTIAATSCSASMMAPRL